MSRPFLTARWEKLLLLNYRCPEELLLPLVPAGTELDPWRGAHLVSLVGFQFLDMRVLGMPIPGHRAFVEVNLRFYVRRRVGGEVKKGVVFVRELVPRRLISVAARLLYHEPYRTVPMEDEVTLDEASGGSATYSWRGEGAEHSLTGSVSGPARPLVPGSEAEFVTEHYWGYNRQRGGTTLEYRVEHPRWRVWTCEDARYLKPARASPFGAFDEVLGEEPLSAFLAVGSEVEVHRGAVLTRGA